MSDAAEPLHDERRPAEVQERALVHHGIIWDVVRDTFELGEAGRLTREYVAHTGAVAVLALDDDERVLVIQQYRHPVGTYMWELPAGLLDVDGEAPQVAAARELHEEADTEAGRWDVLVDYLSSPGGSSEALRVYLARDLRDVPEADRHQRHGEELGMPTRRVPLDELVDGVLAGRLTSPSLVVGVLAAAALRARGWQGLRQVGAPWSTRSPGRAAAGGATGA